MANPPRQIEMDVTDLLSRLVACPSVNPNNRTPVEPPFGEERLVQLLIDILKPLGAEIDVTEISQGRVNFVGRFHGVDSNRSLMIEAHGDTVQVDDMTIPPFDPLIKNGKLYGRGSCDTKGGMAAALAAIRSVIQEDRTPPVDLYFVSTCNEECSGAGAYALMEQGFRVGSAVVCEPTDLKIIYAHKGVLRWRITTHGKSAHSSTPELGNNAISMMQKLIGYIDGPLSKLLRSRSHAILGFPTINVGTIRGGMQFNIVPSECVIEVDRRLLPGETVFDATAEIEHGITALRNSWPQFDCSVEQLAHYPSFEESKDGPITRITAQACDHVLGKGELAGAMYGANSAIFKDAGIPCVVLGPGSASKAHTRDEYVELAQVCQAANIYAEIIRRSGDL